MNAIVIRSAHSFEAQSLAALAGATFPLACPEGTLEEDISHFIAHELNATRFAQYLQSPDAIVLVATDGDSLIGYALALGGPSSQPVPANLITGSPTWYLSKLYVLERGHGTGISSRLVDAVAALIKERGVPTLWVATNMYNDRAIKFYLKYGFTQRGTKEFMVGAESHHDYTFELNL